MSVPRASFSLLASLPHLPTDDSVNQGTSSDTVIWSSVEPSAGLISACLPCLGPLLKRDLLMSRFGMKIMNFSSKPDIESSPSRSGAQLDSSYRAEGFKRLYNHPSMELHSAWNSRHPLQTSCSSEYQEPVIPVKEGIPLPGNRIHVRTDQERLSL